MPQFGNKDKYSEADLISALAYLVNKEEFAPISYWINSLKEKAIIEQRSQLCVTNPTLMAVEVGRLSMADEILRTILSKRSTIFDIPPEVINPIPVKKSRKRAIINDPVVGDIDEKSGLTVGVAKFARENGIPIAGGIKK